MSIFGKSKKKEDVPAPPAPGGGFNDIKEEISSNSQDKNSSSSQVPPSFSSSNNSTENQVQPTQSVPPATPPNVSSTVDNSSNSNTGISMNQKDSNENSVLDESLFNLEDFELPDLNDLDSVNGKYNNSDNSSTTLNETKTSNRGENFAKKNNFNINNHYADLKSTHKSDFMPTKGLSHAQDDTYFLTTNEFKHLLELIDLVKERIKTSGQRHMKITSIKAEEDIEYDNMKKDFQFIEDKLYEVDSTIFDR